MHIEIVLVELAKGETMRPACGHLVGEQGAPDRGQVFCLRASGSDVLTCCRACAAKVGRAIDRGVFCASFGPGTMVRL